MSTKKSVLRAEHITAGFASTPSLADLTIEVTSGEPGIGVTGASGIGKSTLINVLHGDTKPRLGSVTYNGRPVSRFAFKDKKRFKASVRRVAQNGFFGVDTRLSVKQAVEDELKAARRAGRATGESASQVLDLMFLEDRFLPRRIHGLSGGERQRLTIALALATRPDILLLDEPTTALDANLKDLVSRRIRDIVTDRGIGLLVTSHDLDLLARLTATVHVLHDGVFVESGPPRQLLTYPQHPATRDIADAYPEAVRALDTRGDSL